jgi:hypothetical protein
MHGLGGHFTHKERFFRRRRLGPKHMGPIALVMWNSESDRENIFAVTVVRQWNTPVLLRRPVVLACLMPGIVLSWISHCLPLLRVCNPDNSIVHLVVVAHHHEPDPIFPSDEACSSTLY